MNGGKKILAVVVAYNPDPDLLRENLRAFADSVDHVLLWRNSPVQLPSLDVETVGDETNQGISAALNYAAGRAIAEGYDYLLTMDQDSVWHEFPDFMALALSENAPEGIYGPRLKDEPQPDYVRVTNLFTSGMLIPVPILKKLGGWRTDFTVDCLDVDLELRAESMGIHSYRLGEGGLVHRLGKRRRVWNLFYVYDYPPERLYSIFRNHIIVFREYGSVAEPVLKQFIHSWVLRRIPRIILGERDVRAKLKAISRGIRDGRSAAITPRPRVALATWFGTPNYGTTLQAYATVQALRAVGAEPDIIARFDEPVNFKAVKDNWNRKHGIRRFWKYAPTPWPEKISRIKDFCEDYLPVTHVVSRKDLARLRSRTDLFLAGSDQLWNCYDHFRGFEFLHFAGDSRKAAFATSIGTGDIPEEYREQFKEYLSGFGPISIREASGVQAVKEVTGRDDIALAPDPTFLLTPSQWGDIAVFPEERPYALVYILRKPDEGVLENIITATCLRNVIIVPSGENPLMGLDLPEHRVQVAGDAGIREFVGLIARASMVITDSYHGVALSANLGREMLILKRFSDDDLSSQNSRIYDICRRLSLEDRIWSGKMPAPLDREALAEKISALREEGLELLKNTVK